MIVYSPGVWDLLHVGHIKFLQRARSLGTKLVVGVPSDAVVQQDKGERPVIDLNERMLMLESIRYVDAVFPYFSLNFMPHLEQLRPDILAVGSTWGSEQRHHDAQEWAINNGRFVILPYSPGISTTKIKKRINAAL